MFYVKTKISDEATINTEITGENVFTICPLCGKEHAVGDISELFGKGDFDLYSTAVYCRECAENRLKEISEKTVYGLQTVWNDGDTINDIYMSKESLLEELDGLLPEINSIKKIEISGTIST